MSNLSKTVYTTVIEVVVVFFNSHAFNTEYMHSDRELMDVFIKAEAFFYIV